MKKLLLSLFSLLMLVGISQQAFAQDSYSIDFEWDIPGSVTLKVATTFQDIPAGAQSYTVITTDQWASITLGAADGYKFVGWIDPDTQATKTSRYVSMSTYVGKKIKVLVEKIENDSKISLNIVNGLSSLTNVKFTQSDREVSGKLSEGNNEVYSTPVFQTGGVRF
ncbi:MAG: hypothetical protein Q4C34_06025 [Bacteroidales bacterium]|nr:hypothetical protein [Bacteroidales bacterium]